MTTASTIILSVAALWFVFFSSVMNVTKGGLFEAFLYKMLPMVFAFLLGLIVFKVI